VPIADSAMLSSTIIKNARLVVYKGATHGMGNKQKDKANEKLLTFSKA
jgi:non-heme chloroperoxidase